MVLAQWPQVMSLTSKVIIAVSSGTVADGDTFNLSTVGMSSALAARPYLPQMHVERRLDLSTVGTMKMTEQ
jgi:hypothetical protein